jgi:hypothetical protein
MKSTKLFGIFGLLAVVVLLIAAARDEPYPASKASIVELPVAYPVENGDVVYALLPNQYDLHGVVPGDASFEGILSPQSFLESYAVGVAIEDADGFNKKTVKVLHEGYVELPAVAPGMHTLGPGMPYFGNTRQAGPIGIVVEYPDSLKGTVRVYVDSGSLAELNWYTTIFS